MFRRESTFMGSAGEEEEEQKRKEVIQCFSEKNTKKKLLEDSETRGKQSASKKKKKKRQPQVMDISEEYDKYAMEQEMKHTGRVYVDRPRDREREFQD